MKSLDTFSGLLSHENAGWQRTSPAHPWNDKRRIFAYLRVRVAADDYMVGGMLLKSQALKAWFR
ncbi:MAG: hypothetical protein HGJ94_13295 [Desulfosarcina sp.]|nr:hypothetical protein [Desulfosarcina sp.]MBC2741760.1 hypothetical protein [Desulfosarcina sp.]MBC2764674.1 hypothetical protein [Desulfosarcina sp.]